MTGTGNHPGPGVVPDGGGPGGLPPGDPGGPQGSMWSRAVTVSELDRHLDELLARLDRFPGRVVILTDNGRPLGEIRSWSLSEPAGETAGGPPGGARAPGG